MVLHCNGKMEEMTAVAAEVPKLTGQAGRRADAALAQRKPAAPIDLAASRAEFLSLMAGAWVPQGELWESARNSV
jgi:beta-N-acetylhexosaminidase